MLTQIQIRGFYDQGFLKLEGVVPRIMVDQARKVLNHSIGQRISNGPSSPGERSPGMSNPTRSNPVITDLFNRSPLVQICESLMGKGNVQAAESAQVALRYPNVMDEDPTLKRGHLDLGAAGVKGAYRRFFTMHAVVYLGDVLDSFGGNYTIWPGSHRFYGGFFKKNGHEVLNNGQPREAVPGEGLMVTGKAGDVVVAHHLIVHGPAPNASPNIRYAAIFRVPHVDVEQNGKEAFTDMWREFPGVREIVPECG